MIEYFGCAAVPFTREIATKDRYKVSFIEQEIAELLQTIEARMSGLIVAPAGAGKTSILRAMSDQLPKARYHLHYVKVTGLSKRDMCREIAKAVGAKSAGTYASLVRSIQARLEESYSTDSIRPVLLIDEAHDMRPDVLSMLRVLTNFDKDSRLVVSIILAGQPTLKKRLYEQGLEDIRQRLAHCAELRLLSREETKGYLKHRIAISGSRTFPFDDGACEAIFEMARGNMRAIDRISYKAMELGAKREESALDQNLIVEAREKLWI